MRIIFLLSIALLTMFSSIAQESAAPASQIRGAVVSDGSPVPFANVAVYHTDSTLAAGGTTDEKGRFAITVPAGAYYLVTTFLTYEDKVVTDLTKEEGQMLSIGKVEMTESSKMLDEIVIEADRSQMEFKLDKRVFNVGSDLANAGSNASEILANVPSVDVDIEGNVSLRGSENVRILIDGKQSGLTGSGNADALRMLQGNMIEKIEVITNPSSKYEAEGEVGILNIVLKKEKKKGFNGSFELQAGYPTNYGGSFNLNYRRDWINMFVSSGLNYRRSPGRGYSIQNYNGPDTVYSFERIRDHTRGGLSTVNRAGADIFINDKNTLTAALLYKFSDGDNTALVEYRDLDANGEVMFVTTRDEDENEVSQDIELSLTHVKTFENEDHKWTTDIRVTQNDDRETAELVQTASNDANPSYQRSSNTEDERNLLFQSDYTHPLGEKAKFEAGVRASIREIENFYSVELRNSDTAAWTFLDAFTDNLVYTENIYAAYALFGNEVNRWSYQAGIRAEYTDINTVLELSEQENPREYLNFFPSAAVNYELTEYNSLQFSYSRRLSRPSFRELIPFFSYTDPRFFYGGNPDLNPEFTDSYEAGFLRMFDKGSFLGSAYYRHTTAVVQRITLTDTTGLLRTFPVNLGTQDAYGVEANLNYTFTKWLRANVSANAYYANIQGSYREESYNTELLTMTTRANAIVNLPKDIDFQANVRYRAPRNTPQGRSLSITTLDLGVSRDFFNGNGTLVFGVKDVFNSGKRRSIIETDYLYSESEFQWRLRQFQLTFNYRINQKKNRGGSRGDGDGLEDGF